MPVLVIANVPYGDAELDKKIVEKISPGGVPPKGAHFRLAGPAEDGWRVVSLWDSEEDFQEFRDSRIAPVLKEIDQPLPEFQVWQIESVMMAE